MPTNITKPAAAADFRHIDAWIFDLDNTLYRADSKLFAQIDARMTRYIADRLQVSDAEAHRLQHDYYERLGSTLSGLMSFHDVDPEHFLADVHDIDLTLIARDEALIGAVEKLPGKRLVFTNGCRRHAERVIERVGLSHAIDTIWDIRAGGFTPKPDKRTYERLIASAGIAPRSAAMFEDMARNLAPAHALGMTTVWLNPASPASEQDGPGPRAGHIHHEIDDLADFLHAIRL